MPFPLGASYTEAVSISLFHLQFKHTSETNETRERLEGCVGRGGDGEGILVLVCQVGISLGAVPATPSTLAWSAACDPQVHRCLH